MSLMTRLNTPKCITPTLMIFESILNYSIPAKIYFCRQQAEKNSQFLTYAEFLFQVGTKSIIIAGKISRLLSKPNLSTVLLDRLWRQPLFKCVLGTSKHTIRCIRPFTILFTIAELDLIRKIVLV